MSRQEEINKLINQNNDSLESILSTTTFELNPKTSQLISENRQLQQECGHLGHNYVNGVCTYCYAEKPKGE